MFSALVVVRTIPCPQAVSGVISDVKTALRVRRLLSPSRIPNETSAKSSKQHARATYLGYAVLEDLRKLNWLPIIKRRYLALLKITHTAIYAMMFGLINYALNSILSADNLRSLEAPMLAIPTECGT